MADVSAGFKGSTTAFAAAAVAAASSAAGAADLSIVKAPPVPVVGWQGFYVGASVGASWLNTTSNDPGTLATNTLGPITNINSGGSITSASQLGWLGGLDLGYNWQQGKFVFGLEGDFSWLGGNSTSTSGSSSRIYGLYGTPGRTYTAATTFTSQVTELATIRGRVGVDIDGTLPYLTAGLAIGHVKDTYGASGYTPVSTGGTVFAGTSTQSSWVPGIVLGGGIEHKLTSNWTIRGEVLWVGLVGRNVASFPLSSTVRYGAVSNGASVKFSDELTIGKIGLNYRF
jgi:outer membrane immunogenic protein